MFELGKYRVLAVLAGMMLLVSACGAPAGQEASISTAVAQTVQAGESLTQVASLPTFTPQVTVPPGTPLPGANTYECAHPGLSAFRPGLRQGFPGG